MAMRSSHLHGLWIISHGIGMGDRVTMVKTDRPLLLPVPQMGNRARIQSAYNGSTTWSRELSVTT